MSKISDEEKQARIDAIGTLCDIFLKLRKEVKNCGGTDVDVYDLNTANGEPVLKEVAKIIADGGIRSRQPKPSFTMVEFPLTIFKISLREKIKKAKLDWVNDSINDNNFPVTGKEGPTTAIIIHFGRYMSSEKVFEEMEKNGLRPGNMYELADFASEHPDEQRKYPIVELSSGWLDSVGNRNVGVLYKNVRERKLLLSWFFTDWSDNDRFLAFRK
ncbi:MAG: hypothetical protein V1707_00145 [bacterium]